MTQLLAKKPDKKLGYPHPGIFFFQEILGSLVDPAFTQFLLWYFKLVDNEWPCKTLDTW